MGDILEFIWDGIAGIFEMVVDFISLIIDGILEFSRHVVQYFRGLKLRKGRDMPFIANEQSEKFRQMIHQAPVKDAGIFQGTYNEDTNEIENCRSLEADELDEKTKQILGNEPLVVLT